MSLPESTKQLIALKQKVAEDVEIPVSPTHLVMRGTLYQNSEAEQSSCPSPPPLHSESNQSIESLRNRYTIFIHTIYLRVIELFFEDNIGLTIFNTSTPLYIK